jgi:hypothetical protein
MCRCSPQTGNSRAARAPRLAAYISLAWAHFVRGRTQPHARASSCHGSLRFRRRADARAPRPLRRRVVLDGAAPAAAGDAARELRGEVGVQDGEPEAAGVVPEPGPVPGDQRRHRRGCGAPRRGVRQGDRRRRPQARPRRLGRHDHAFQLQVNFRNEERLAIHCLNDSSFRSIGLTGISANGGRTRVQCLRVPFRRFELRPDW